MIQLSTDVGNPAQWHIFLHAAHGGQEVALEVSPCSRGFAGKIGSHGTQLSSNRDTTSRG